MESDFGVGMKNTDSILVVTLGVLSALGSITSIFLYFGLGPLPSSGKSAYEIGSAALSIVSVIGLALVYMRWKKLHDQVTSLYNSNVSLLDTLYSNSKFRLLRYQHDHDVIDGTNDCDITKTYILTASEPQTEMSCYVEYRSSDDPSRIFDELQKSCRGGKVRDKYRTFPGGKPNWAALDFIIDFDPAIQRAEHTLSMSCRLKGYFAAYFFEDLVHMALPTDRSILNFAFPKNTSFTGLSTVLIDPTGNATGRLPTDNFTSIRDGHIKWEISRPKFGTFYRISFGIVR
jgi:hypothetical protein